jgi:hypothetical protein
VQLTVTHSRCLLQVWTRQKSCTTRFKRSVATRRSSSTSASRVNLFSSHTQCPHQRRSPSSHPQKCTRTPTLEPLADIAHMFCTALFRCLCFYVSQPPKILGNYVIGNRLGEGAFGRVKEAVHIRNLERVAIKIMKVKRSTLTELNSTHVRAHTHNHARMRVWWWR